MKNILSILAVLLISACAYTPQDAKLSAHAQIENSNIGAGTLIEVKVHDERTSKSLGHRGAAAFKGAKITTGQDIAALLHSALTEAYTKKGFVFNNSDNLIPAKIRVDLREFNYYKHRFLDWWCAYKSCCKN